MNRRHADIERGPPPSRMEKTITVLSRVFKAKRFVGIFFVVWVAFAFVCANQGDIAQFLHSTSKTRTLKAKTRSVFRSDRSVQHTQLEKLGGEGTCDYIEDNLNVRGIVMFLPEIVQRGAKTVRVKETQPDGTQKTNERHTCVVVKWTDQNYAEYTKQVCQHDAFCVQHLLDLIQARAHTEL